MSYYGFLVLHLKTVQLKVKYSTLFEDNKIKFSLNLALTIGGLSSSGSLGVHDYVIKYTSGNNRV
jgi:hypothetical protein